LSKFLRVMALSKRPSDFQTKDTVPPNEPEKAAGALEDTVPLNVGTEDTVSLDKVVKTRDTVPLKNTGPIIVRPKTAPAPALAGPNNVRLYRCTLVQHGHSFAEERLYNALWNSKLAQAETKDTKLISIGWDKMARLAAMTPRNVRENCFRLMSKLALERVHGHVSEERIGTTYRIYSFDAILARRRTAGLEWVTRNRGGVTFVQPQSGPSPSLRDTVPFKPPPLRETVSSQGTDTVPSQDTDTVPSQGTPYSQKLSQPGSHPSSPSCAVVEALRSVAPGCDDDVASELIADCRHRAPDATDNEIAHFILLKAQTPGIRTPLGFLRNVVPRCFEGESFRQYREEQRLKAEQGARDHARVLAQWRQILDDPNTTEQEREIAREVLQASNR
jgi:hypothetical protein